MTYELRALQLLDKLLIDELDSAHKALGQGVFIKEDAATTGMNYAKQAGRISGLTQARNYMKQVEEELTGRKDVKKGQ